MLRVGVWISRLAMIFLVSGVMLTYQTSAAAVVPVTTVLAVDPHHIPGIPNVQARLCQGSGPCENGKDGVAVVMLLSGTPPAAATPAKVLTDTNCDPDQRGISHCLNILQLRSGGTLTVRHDHDMMVYPCLTPGSTVQVIGFDKTR